MSKENTEKINTESTNAQQCRKITVCGMVINMILAALKIIVGSIGGSSSVTADGIHSLSDLSTDIAVIIGVKYWNLPPDVNHPYGHKRMEAMTSVFIGIVLALAGIFMGWNAIDKFKKGVYETPENIAFWAAIISIISKEWLYHKTFAVGKKCKSMAVIANAWHHRSDSLSSIPVAIAVALAMYNEEWAFLDSVATLAVSAFIINAAWGICFPALKELSDSGADAELIKEIKELVLSVEGVKSVHAIRTRYQGSGLCMDLHIQVDGNLTVREGHNIAGKAKYMLLNANMDILSVLVHIEPTD